MDRDRRATDRLPRLVPGTGLVPFPPAESWDDWEEYDAKAWPERVKRRYRLVPTTCFNCEAGCGLLAYVDKDSGRVRPLRGQPRASRIEGPQLRQGTGHPQPDVRPGADPPPAAKGRPARWRGVGTRLLGGRPQGHSIPHPHRPARGPARRDHLPRGAARRGRLHRPHPPVLGGGRAQQPHQHLLVGGAHRLRHVDGLRPAVGRLRQRPLHPPAVGPARVRALLQPACAAHHRGPPGGCAGGHHRPAPLEHRLDVRPLAVTVAGYGGVHDAGHRRPAARVGRRGPRVHAQVGQLGGVAGRAGARTAPYLREFLRAAARDLCRLHDRVRRRRDRGGSRTYRGCRQGHRRSGKPLRLPHLAGRRIGEPRGLAGCPLPLFPARPDGIGGNGGWHVAQRLG